MFMRENLLCDIHSKMLHKMLTFKSYTCTYLCRSAQFLHNIRSFFVSCSDLFEYDNKTLEFDEFVTFMFFLSFTYLPFSRSKKHCVSFIFLSYNIVQSPVGTFINCARRPCFRASARGIGYSFQLAITTPQMNLIGYGTATAQS